MGQQIGDLCGCKCFAADVIGARTLTEGSRKENDVMHRRDLLQVFSYSGGAGSVARCADAAGPVPCRSGFERSLPPEALRFGPRR